MHAAHRRYVRFVPLSRSSHRRERPLTVGPWQMSVWLPPLAAASLTVLLLNIALFVQRARKRAEDWPARFLCELRSRDGRLAQKLDRTAGPS
jgi:hypothetical protein